MRALRLVGCVLLVGCVGDSGVGPQDSGGPDQTVGGDAGPPDGGSDGEGGIVDPTWTLPLGATSALNGVATDAFGGVYVAGSVSAPLSLGSVNIASTQGADVLIIKLDPKTKQPVWGVSYGGPGDETAVGIAVSSSGVFIVGTTTGATLQFGKTQLQIPASTGNVSMHSFIARIDPSDGTVGWAISPDQSRSSATAHQSACTSIAVQNNNVSIGCTYQGASFGYDTTKPAWTPGLGQSAFAVFHFTDGASPITQWTKSLASTTGAALSFPAVAIDSSGDTWLGGVFSAQGSVLEDMPTAAQIVTGAGQDNPFVLKIATATQAIGPAKAWGASNSGKAASILFGLTTVGTNVFASGMYAGAAVNFGLGALPSSQGLDMFALELDNTALGTTWQFELGGSLLDVVRSLATDGTSTYLGMAWTSTGVSFNNKALPAPASASFGTAIGKLDATGKPVSFLPITSANASVEYLGLMIDPKSNALYGVGTFGGQTTFDDNTQVLGDAVNGNGFLVRRPKF